MGFNWDALLKKIAELDVKVKDRTTAGPFFSKKIWREFRNFCKPISASKVLEVKMVEMMEEAKGKK